MGRVVACSGFLLFLLYQLNAFPGGKFGELFGRVYDLFLFDKDGGTSGLPAFLAFGFGFHDYIPIVITNKKDNGNGNKAGYEQSGEKSKNRKRG